jgi:cytochrome c peroxidase
VTRTRIGLVLAGLLLLAATPRLQEPDHGIFTWDLPAGWPLPRVPPGNAMSPAKVTLGRWLFYDTALSANGTQACATCHQQAHAFADPRPRAVGSTGQRHARGSMSLVNVAYASTLTWANPAMTALEDQARVPMFGDQPIELGLSSADSRWLARLGARGEYRRMFAAAFGAAPDPLTVENVTRALASFERSIVSARSAYDRFSDGDERAISTSAQRGEQLYFSPRLGCFRCHGSFTFSQPPDFAGRSEVERGEAPLFQNNGIYAYTGRLTDPGIHSGIFAVTQQPLDLGKFKPPTLRNIAVTAPYMHDGSLATLDEVLDHYARGGREHPTKSTIVRGFTLSAGERSDLLAFLNALTDEALLHDPRFADPWQTAGGRSRP